MRYITIGAVAVVLAFGVFVGCEKKVEEVAEPTMTIDEAKAKLVEFMNGVNDRIGAITSDETLKPEEGFAKLLTVVKEEKAKLETLAGEFEAIENIPEEEQPAYDELNAKVGELADALAALEKAYSADFAKMKPDELEAWNANYDATMTAISSIAEYCGAEKPGGEEPAAEETPMEEAPAKETPATEGGK